MQQPLLTDVAVSKLQSVEKLEQKAFARHKI
jgi:hypothetical protein